MQTVIATYLFLLLLETFLLELGKRVWAEARLTQGWRSSLICRWGPSSFSLVTDYFSVTSLPKRISLKLVPPRPFRHPQPHTQSHLPEQFCVLSANAGPMWKMPCSRLPRTRGHICWHYWHTKAPHGVTLKHHCRRVSRQQEDEFCFFQNRNYIYFFYFFLTNKGASRDVWNTHFSAGGVSNQLINNSYGVIPPLCSTFSTLHRKRLWRSC